MMFKIFRIVAVCTTFLGMNHALYAADSGFDSWLAQKPDGYFHYVYELGGQCAETFCSPNYNGHSVSLNCRNPSDSGALFGLTLVGRKGAMKVQFESKITGRTLTADLQGAGKWTFDQSSSHIMDMHFEGVIDGDTTTATIQENSYRQDPYLGWYADRSIQCFGLRGGYLPSQSSITLAPSDGQWWSELGTGTVSKSIQGGLHAFIRFSNGQQAPVDLGNISMQMKLQGVAPAGLEIVLTGGYGIPAGLNAKSKVSEKDGSFEVSWVSGADTGSIHGQVSRSRLYIDDLHFRSTIPSASDTYIEEPQFIGI